MLVTSPYCFGFFLFFMKAILSFFDFWTIFCCFFNFLCTFALTFHKRQIVMKAILSFFDFWTIFCCFFIFLFISALTFHKCQIVMKAILSFLIFGPFFVVFDFSFHFCFDFPQMSNCYESDSFIFIFCPFFLKVCWAPLLLFPSGFLCAFLFVFSLLFGLFWVPGDHGERRGRGL